MPEPRCTVLVKYALLYRSTRLKGETRAESAARLPLRSEQSSYGWTCVTAQSHIENLDQENEKLCSKVRLLTKRVVRFEREVQRN
jgi:diadenosine tetraphosphate (Ap4A) HIT family hydrolase